MNGGDLVCCFEITAELLISLGFIPDSGGYTLNKVHIWKQSGTWRAGVSGLHRIIKTRADFLAFVQISETEIV